MNYEFVGFKFKVGGEKENQAVNGKFSGADLVRVSRAKFHKRIWKRSSLSLFKGREVRVNMSKWIWVPKRKQNDHFSSVRENRDHLFGDNVAQDAVDVVADSFENVHDNGMTSCLPDNCYAPTFT